MKAANIEIESKGYVLAYSESEFGDAVNDLRDIASKHNK